MKILSLATLLACTTSVSAFAPHPMARQLTMPRHQTARFASDDAKTLDEEVEEMVQKEISKTQRMSNLRNERGQEYAPWMKISPEDEKQIRALMREKAEARRKRKEQEQQVKGSLLRDSAFQELSGSGLKSKVVDGNSVELEWATGEERGTQGFIVKRRPAKTDAFEVIASYETFGPLQSKGREGGIYRYLDENVAPGGWVYRITETDTSGKENDLSQCLVEIQTDEEKQGALIAAIGLGIVAVAAVAAGVFMDPYQY